MKTFNLRFSLEADMFVEVEAESEEAAFNKLRAMDSDEILEAGYIRDCEVRDEEVADVKEEHLTFDAKLTNVEWEADSELNPTTITVEGLTADNYHGAVDDSDIRDAIEDDLWQSFGDVPKSFDYEITRRN